MYLYIVKNANCHLCYLSNDPASVHWCNMVAEVLPALLLLTVIFTHAGNKNKKTQTKITMDDVNGFFSCQTFSHLQTHDYACPKGLSANEE